MALTMLVYGSASRLDPSAADDVVASIVAQARLANARHGITGALLFTGSNFVQVLEAQANAVDALMAKLWADERHGDLVVASHGAIAERRFDGWALAYSGPSHFIGKRVRSLLETADPAGQRRAARWLVDLMHQYADS